MNARFTRITLAGALVAASLFATGCANFRPAHTYNPPPAEPLNKFTAYELKPVTTAPHVSSQHTSVRKINAILAKSMDPVVRQWNQEGAARATNGNETRTLVIQPEVADIRRVRMAGRIFLGPILGNSGVRMRMTLTEKETSKVVATPEFFRGNNAFIGWFTAGVLDNIMLNAAAARVQNYLVNNYNSAVGGPTGAQ